MIIRTRRHRKLSRGRPTGWVVLGAVVLAFLIFVLLFDVAWLKGTIERRVSAATGRSFEIAGPLSGRVRWVTTVKADDVHFGNVDWSKDREMASAKRVELEIATLPLLIGRYDIRAIRVEEPKLLIERDAQRRGNLDFLSEKSRHDGPPIEIGQLSIARGELRVEDVPWRTSLKIRLDSGKPGEGETAVPTAVDGSGRYRGFDFEIAGAIASPLQLRDRGKPYTLDLKARAGGTHARLAGTLLHPMRFDGLDARFELSGPDIADLYPLLEVPLPPSPPYEVAGQLRRNEHVWNYDRYAGRVGDSDVAGDVIIDASRERARMTIGVKSQRLDLDDLAGLFGLPPQTGEGETASTAQKAEAAKREAEPTVLPTREYDLKKLRAMDIEMTFAAAEIHAPSLPLQGADAHAELDSGLLQVDSMDLRAAGGHITGSLTLDARRDTIHTTTELTLRGLGLAQLFPDVDLGTTNAGRIAGRVELAGNGNSVARMLATSNGEVGVVMGKGQISNLLIELAGLDIAESLKFMIGKDRNIPIRCAFARFGVKDGVMRSTELALDTSDSAIVGEVAVNLQDESLDGKLRVQPHDRSLLALRSPLKIGGTLKDPSFGPEGKALVLRGVASAVLYALAPPAALAALVETGEGEDAGCRAAIENDAAKR